MPVVAEALMGYLEGVYPAQRLAEIPKRKCLVLLGGAVAPPIYPRVEVELVDSSDRVRIAARLYREGKVDVVIVTAGNHPFSRHSTAEAEIIAPLLQEWGVPLHAIRIEALSRNTRENALNSKILILEEQCGPPLLVTSAAHMPRAVAAFAAVGIDVTAVSTDIRITPGTSLRLNDFLPDAGAMATTSAALRELLGQLVYRWRGWN